MAFMLKFVPQSQIANLLGNLVPDQPNQFDIEVAKRTEKSSGKPEVVGYPDDDEGGTQDAASRGSETHTARVVKGKRAAPSLVVGFNTSL